MVEREIGHINVQVKTSMVMEEGTRKDCRYEKIWELFVLRFSVLFVLGFNRFTKSKEKH